MPAACPIAPGVQAHPNVRLTLRVTTGRIRAASLTEDARTSSQTNETISPRDEPKTDSRCELDRCLEQVVVAALRTRL
jgi:hypothetical protein